MSRVPSVVIIAHLLPAVIIVCKTRVMDSYTARNMRTNLREILRAVDRGGMVEIKRYDVPTAILVPPELLKRACAALGEPVPDFVPAADKAGEKK
jgi:antitoxin (DNA-binding transcriptional repressor) of toxin-antitoxin stability system